MFWEIFSRLCSQRGKSPNAVAKELKISSGSITNWKNGTIPNNSALLKLANYFNVSVDYLLGKEDTPMPQDTTGFVVTNRGDVHMVPVYDTVSAGFGTTAEDKPTEYIPMSFESEYDAENTICIRVKGDSMAPIINNGDIVHVFKRDFIERGYMAVVLVDDEGFVKYLDYGTGWIELVSQNPMYRTMRFEGPELERVRVVGLVTGITRRGVPHMNK